MADKNVQIRIGVRDQASASLKNISRNVRMLTGRFRELGNAAGQSMQVAGRGISRAGALMTAGAAGITAGFASSAMAFGRFDDAMKAVQAKVTFTTASISDLEAKAKQLGETTQFTAVEAARGMEFLAQAGFKSGEIMTAIGPALDLATAGNISLAETADIATNVLGGFGMEVEEFERVVNVMARTATNANTNVLMMGETFVHAASTARNAGQTIEETSAVIGLLGNAGIQASLAGTDFKNAVTKMTKNEGKLREMGVEIRNSADGFRPVLDVMHELGQELKDMNEVDRVAKVMEIFGLRSAKSAQVLANLTIPEIVEMRNAMGDTEVTAASMAETMMSGFGRLGIKVKSAFEGMKIAIGESLEGPLRVVGDQLIRFIRSITDLATKSPETFRQIALGGLTIGALGIAATTAGFAITGMGIALVGVTTIISTMGTFAAAIFTPLGLAIAAVGAAALVMGADFIKTAHKFGLLNDALGHLQGILKETVRIFKETFNGMSDAIQAGNLPLAIEILVAGMRLAFWNGMQKLVIAFGSMMHKLLVVTVEWGSKWLDIIARVVSNGIKIFHQPWKAVDLASAMKEGLTEMLGGGDGLSDAVATAIVDGRKKALSDLAKLKAKAKSQKDMRAAIHAMGGGNLGSQTNAALAAARDLGAKVGAAFSPDMGFKDRKRTAKGPGTFNALGDAKSMSRFAKTIADAVKDGVKKAEDKKRAADKAKREQEKRQREAEQARAEAKAKAKAAEPGVLTANVSRLGTRGSAQQGLTKVQQEQRKTTKAVVAVKGALDEVARALAGEPNEENGVELVG